MTNLSDIDKEKNIFGGGGWDLQNDHVESWVYAENVFNRYECEEIIKLGNSLQEKTASIVRNGGLEDSDIRESFVSWIFPCESSFWIFERLSSVINELNSTFFKFDLHSFSEGLQFTKYHAPSGHYSKHVDKIHRSKVRKLSISVQLNDPKEYDGGDLVLYYSEEGGSMPPQQGKLVAFPSYVVHEVTPVTRGTRYSLVAWVSGPPFK